MADRDEQIRERAYTLWEQDGRQHGRDLLHWDQATRDVDGPPAPEDAAEQEAEESVEVIDVAKAATAARRRAKKTA